MAERLNLGDLIYRLGFESEDEFLRALEGVLNRADAEAKKQGKKAGKSFAGDFANSFKSEFGSVFAGATLGSALGTVLGQAFNQAMAATRQFVTDSNREFRTYQLSLNQIAVAGVKDLSAIKEQIKAVSDEAKLFSETDIASSVAELIKAGFDAADALQLVRGSVNTAASDVNAATGEFADLTGTSVQLGNVLRSLGLPMSDIGRLTDVVAQGAQASNLSTTQLTQILSELGGIAKTAGIPLEQLAAAAAELSNRGESAETIATGLRSAISALIDPPATVKKQFDALGISLVDSNGKTRNFLEVIGNLERVTSAGGRGLQFLASGMDTIALQIVSKLGGSRREIQGLEANLRNAGGAAEELRKGVNAGLEPIRDFEREIQNAKRALGEQLQPVLVDFYTNIAPELISALSTIVSLYKQWRELTGGNFQAEGSALEQFRKDLADTETLVKKLASGELTEAQLKRLFGLSVEQLLQQQRALRRIVERLENAAKPGEDTILQPPFLTGEKPSTPANIPDTGGGGTKTEDAIVKQARELEGQLRVLQERYKLGRIDAAQYRAELERLQRQLQALEKSATTTERKQAVLGGLGGVKDALEALEKAKIQPRLEALGKELERQNRLFGDTKNVGQYAGALADLQQKAEALKKQTTSAEVKKQIDELLARIAEGRKKLEDTLTQLGEEAASEIGAAAAERLQRVYGDGFQAAVSAIRRSFPDFNAALSGLLEQGFSEEDARELAARAFPENFLELAFANLDKTVDPETTGFADMGARLGANAGKAFTASFTDVVKNQRRLELADKVFSFDELKAFSDQELLELRDLLKEIGLEGSAAFEQINAELAFRDPALAAKIEEEKALAEAYYQVQDGAEAAARGIEEYRQFLESLSLGGILDEIDRLQAALARGFDRPEEAEAARQQLDAATKALLANLDAQREGVERGIVSEEAFAASLEAVIAFLKRKAEGLDASSAAALVLRNQIAALEAELRRLGLIETPLTSGEFSDGLKTFDERARDALDALDLLRQEFDLGLASQGDYAQALQDTIQYLELLAAEEGTTAEQARLLAIRIAQLKKELEELGKARKRDEPEKSPRQELEEVEKKIKEVETQIAKAERDKLHFKVDSEEFREAEKNIVHLQARLQQLRQEAIRLTVKLDIEENLPKIMLNGAKAFIDGLQEGDLEGAFRKIFENVTDYFETLLIQAILGPIAQQLAASVAQALAPLIAANPLAALGILAGVVTLGALASSPKSADQKAAEQQKLRGASSVKLQVETTINANIGTEITDPRTRLAIAQIAEEVTTRALVRLGLIDVKRLGGAS